MLDREFLRRCQIPSKAFPTSVALAARRAIAESATVSPETVWPEDSFAGDLVQLPFWDSLDWLGFLIEVEIAIGGEFDLTSGSIIDIAVELAGGDYSDLQVQHLIRSPVAAATHPLRDAMFDDEVP